MDENNTSFTGSEYPNSIDVYNIPSDPDTAYLSQNDNYPGSHSVSHQALNDSVEAIEKNALVDNSNTSHTHSDPYNVDYSQEPYASSPSKKMGRQLEIVNTHITSDTHTAPTAQEAQSPDSNANTWHHTVATSSTSSPSDFQAISYQLWNYLGLSGLSKNYFSQSLPNTLNNIQQQLTGTSQSNADVIQQLDTLKGLLLGLLESFNAYYNSRCNEFIGEYPADTIAFTPTSVINQVQSGGLTTNYAQVDVFSRWAILHLHPFFSAHNGIESQIEIFHQTPQEDGSYWAPNYEIFFPMAIQEQDVNNPDTNWSRDLSWKPDGNIYTSSLGNAGEFDRPVMTIAKMPANIEMLHLDSNGNTITATNQAPFIIPQNVGNVTTSGN